MLENKKRSNFVCKVPLGRTVITRTALVELPHQDIWAALQRHQSGDWGDLDRFDKQASDDALRSGGRLLSAYRTKRGVKFWIITEADRSTSTVLLPRDY